MLLGIEQVVGWPHVYYVGPGMWRWNKLKINPDTGDTTEKLGAGFCRTPMSSRDVNAVFDQEQTFDNVWLSEGKEMPLQADAYIVCMINLMLTLNLDNLIM